MADLLSGKFEFKIWIGVLFILVAFVLTVLSDQATFVQPPRNRIEAFLTLLPVLLYLITDDRTACFVLVLAVYGSLLGGLGAILWALLEKYLFEPLFVKRMIRTKLREEKLFNRYISELTS